MYTYASAFAGIGGMTMGLEPLGFKGVMAWEFNPFSKVQHAQNAHQLLHPDIQVSGDICATKTASVPDMDVLCFTPPCQPFSITGKRTGFSDTRGTLIFEVFRIIQAKKPKVLFMENVSGLIHHAQGHTLRVITSTLEDLGYQVSYRLLNSQQYGTAQNRLRLYLIGLRKDHFGELTVFPWETLEQKVYTPQTLEDVMEPHADKMYYLTEQQASPIIQQMHHHQFRVSERNQVICLNPRNCEGKQTYQQQRTYYYKGKMTTLQAALGGRYRVAFPNTSSIDAPTFEYEGESLTIRNLTPDECMVLQQIPIRDRQILEEHFTPQQIYRFTGNGLTVNVIREIGVIIRELLDKHNK